jgi:hypothetical protein
MSDAMTDEAMDALLEAAIQARHAASRVWLTTQDLGEATAHLERFWALADELRDRYGVPIAETCTHATRGLA